MFDDLRPFRWKDACGDARAGITLAAMNIPQVLGYTRIAGMPVVTGLYTLLAPLVAFAAFGSSRYLVVAADSATAAILAGGLAGMAPMASPAWVTLAGYVALLTGGFLLLGRILRLGFIADFLSQTVLVGFLTGVGFQVGDCGVGRDDRVARPIAANHWTGDRNSARIAGAPSSRAAGLGSGAGIGAGPALSGSEGARAPWSAVVSVTAASALWQFSAHGIPTIGAVAGGLPHPSLHLLPWRQILALVPVAGSCAIMIVTQSAATARVYALRHDQNLDENRDLGGAFRGQRGRGADRQLCGKRQPHPDGDGGDLRRRKARRRNWQQQRWSACVLLVFHAPARVSAAVRARRAGACWLRFT